MATNPTRAMRSRYEEARRALEVAMTDERVMVRLRRVGFGQQQLGDGEALLAGVHHAMEQAGEALEAQRSSTHTARQMRRQLEAAYRDAIQLVRIYLGEEHPWVKEAMAADGKQMHSADHSLEALLARSRYFFAAAQQAPGEIQARLQEMGLGGAAVGMGLGLVQGVENAVERQQRLRDQAEAAVTVRANAFEALDEWMRAFRTIARVALRDRPQLLMEMGIKPRGRPRKLAG